MAGRRRGPPNESSSDGQDNRTPGLDRGRVREGAGMSGFVWPYNDRPVQVAGGSNAVRLVSSAMFRDAAAGARELVKNAVQSVQRAGADGLPGAGTVRVTLNEESIRVEDDGTGLAKAGAEALRVIGGDRGSGFFSYLGIGPEAVIDTMLEDGTGFRMVCRDGATFEVAGPSMRDGRGTTVTVGIKPSPGRSITYMLHRIGQMTPVRLIVDNHGYKDEGDGPIPTASEHEVFEATTLAGTAAWYERELKAECLLSEHDDFGILCIKRLEDEPYTMASASGMPIAAPTWLPYFNTMLEVRDPGRYRLMPGGEALDTASARDLEERILGEVGPALHGEARKLGSPRIEYPLSEWMFRKIVREYW